MAFGDDSGSAIWNIAILAILGGAAYVGYQNRDKLAQLWDLLTGGGGGCTKTCAAGSHLVEASCSCVPDSCTKTCTAPQVLDSTCTCVTPAPCNGKTCGAGTVLNTSTCNCDVTGGGGGSFSFAAAGDFGTGGKAVASAMVAAKPSLVVGLGDYGYDSVANFKPSFDIIKASNIPHIWTQGNHDVSAGSGFLSMFGQSSWIFTKNYSGISFVSLNSENSSGTMSAVDNACKAATGKFRVAIMHKPIYTVTSKHAADEGHIKGVVPILEKYGFQLVLAGHNHHYARYKACPIAGGKTMTFITAGGGGKGNYPCGSGCVCPCNSTTSVTCDAGSHGFLKGVVNGNSLQCAYVKTGGGVGDSFTIAA